MTLSCRSRLDSLQRQHSAEIDAVAAEAEATLRKQRNDWNATEERINKDLGDKDTQLQKERERVRELQEEVSVPHPFHLIQLVPITTGRRVKKGKRVGETVGTKRDGGEGKITAGSSPARTGRSDTRVARGGSCKRTDAPSRKGSECSQ